MMGTMLSDDPGTKSRTLFGATRLSRLVPLALVAILALGAAGAKAADDDDDRSPESRVLDTVMKNLGLRGDGESIDYRERSPLVVPPRVDLPQPERATAPVANWPRDPDVRRAKEAAAAAAKQRPKTFEEDSRPLTPAELNRGARTGRSAETTPGGGSGSSVDPFRVLSPTELGFKGFGNAFGLKSEEAAKFTGEPERSSLTQPPVGYQTPSPNYAYGVGPAKPKAYQNIDESAPLPPGKY